MDVKNRGVAIAEFLFMFIIFIFVMVLLYGSWGVIHSGILNSISARAYATYVISNRSDLSFVRDYGEEDILDQSYFNTRAENPKNIRFFSIIKPDNPLSEKDFIPEQLRLDLGYWHSGSLEHISDEEGQEWSSEIRPNVRILPRYKAHVVYLKQGYGICLDAPCGN